MLYNTQFNVLVVDDEPDVLSLTKMLLRDIEVYGVPINVETARSKAEAIEVFGRYNQPSSNQQMISVVLIDVVMETDHAGLELCDYIRNEQNNYVTQLYIRTGQPGAAPERKVVDDYDINGYFTKTEMDEDKLYSIVKSGIRQANTMSLAIGLFTGAEAAVMYGQTRDSLEGMMRTISQAIQSSGEGTTDGGPLTKVDSVMILDGYTMSTLSDQEAEQLQARLEQMEHHPLNEMGDYYTSDANSYLVYVAPSPTTAECYGYSRTQIEPTPYALALLHKYYRVVSSVWKRGGNVSPAGEEIAVPV